MDYTRNTPSRSDGLGFFDKIIDTVGGILGGGKSQPAGPTIINQPPADGGNGSGFDPIVANILGQLSSLTSSIVNKEQKGEGNDTEAQVLKRRVRQLKRQLRQRQTGAAGLILPAAIVGGAFLLSRKGGK